MENIKAFLDAVEKYGIAKEDTFVTVDLFEGRNMKQVIVTRLYRKVDYLRCYEVSARVWVCPLIYPHQKTLCFQMKSYSSSD